MHLRAPRIHKSRHQPLAGRGPLHTRHIPSCRRHGAVGALCGGRCSVFLKPRLITSVTTRYTTREYRRLPKSEYMSSRRALYPHTCVQTHGACAHAMCACATGIPAAKKDEGVVARRMVPWAEQTDVGVGGPVLVSGGDSAPGSRILQRTTSRVWLVWRARAISTRPVAISQ
jgi:hypothetical protein